MRRVVFWKLAQIQILYHERGRRGPEASTGIDKACLSQRGCEKQIVTSSASGHIMCEALPIVMLGFPERFPITTARDTSDETEKLAKAPLISHSSLYIEVQESGLFY